MQPKMEFIISKIQNTGRQAIEDLYTSLKKHPSENM
jgi:hypothetical protein